MVTLLSLLVGGGTAVIAIEDVSFCPQISRNISMPTFHMVQRISHNTPDFAPNALKVSQRQSSYPILWFILGACSFSRSSRIVPGYSVGNYCAMLEASHQMISNPLQKHEPNKPGIVGKPTGSDLAIFSDNGVI